MRKLALILLGVIGLPLFAQNAILEAQFEVASIRECREAGTPPVKSSPRRLTLTCWPLLRIIQDAYEVFEDGKMNPRNPYPLTRIEGGPDWMNSAKYSINATTAEPESVAMISGPVMRKLLGERFRLKVHRETREVPAYIMTVPKGGSKLQVTKEGSCNYLDTTDPSQSLKVMPGGKPWCVITPQTKNGSHFVWDVRGMGMDVFAKLININGIPVIDQTGLTGTFDIHLEYDFFPPTAADNGGASDPSGTSIASAIRSQLGLQLTRGTGPREFLVIDHLERPSEN
jgi:uncharacterized protein (TIGR03435 family)